MSTPTTTKPPKQETPKLLREAVNEVQQAIRPNAKPSRRPVREGISWTAAIGAGLLVLLTGLKQSRQIGDVPPLPLTAGKPADPTTSVERLAQVYEIAEPHPAPPQGIVAIGKDLIQRFMIMEGATRGAALAFAGVFALIPILLFGLAILGQFVTPETAVADVQKYISGLLPGKQAAAAAAAVIKESNLVEAVRGLRNLSSISTWVGLGGTIFAATSLFAAASDPMNKAWGVTETRNFFKLRIICFGVLLGAGALFLLSLIPTAGPDAIRSLNIPWLNLPQPVPGWLDVLIGLFAIPINMGMFVLIYKYLPNAKVSWKAAALAGMIVGILWEIFKRGFSTYLSNFGNYNKLYGAFGGIALLVTWIYYSCIVMLLGAAICKMIQERMEWRERKNTGSSTPIVEIPA